MSADLPEFRDFIRSRRAALAGFMEKGAALKHDGDILTAIPLHEKYVRYLAGQLGVLGQLASELFGREITAQLESINDSPQRKPVPQHSDLRGINGPDAEGKDRLTASNSSSNGAGVAQAVEQGTRKAPVAGSTPAASSKPPLSSPPPRPDFAKVYEDLVADASNGKKGRSNSNDDNSSTNRSGYHRNRNSNDDDLLRRVPPQNLEAEQSVLGAILLANESLDEAQRIVKANDFYRDAHREIYGAMLGLWQSQIPIDAITLTQALKGRNALETIGGPAYIAELAAAVPTAQHIAHYSTIVRDMAVKRELASKATTIASLAYDGVSVDALLGEAARLLEPTVASGQQQLLALKAPESMDDAAFHGTTGELVRLIEPHTESSMAAMMVQFLVYAGNVVGRNQYRIIDGARHSTNLMAIVVGNTSSARKGSSWAQVRRFAGLVDEAWIKDHLQTGLSSGEGLIWAVRDPIERREPVMENGCHTGEFQPTVIDPGVSDKRLMVVESEFMRVLKMAERDGNTLSMTLRNAWDTGDLQNLTKNSPVKATGAHISVVGHITREELLRGLNSTEAANGFANRFLWVYARRSKLLPFGGNLPESAFGRLVVQMREVLKWCETPRDIGFSGEASRVWESLYPGLSADRVGLLGAIVARAAAQVVRLACLYAVLDRSGQIEVDHLRAAVAVWSYCEASAEFIFGDRLGDPDADAILAALRSSPDGLTRTQIRDLFSRNFSTNRIERALTTLVTHHLATIERAATAGSSGRNLARI